MSGAWTRRITGVLLCTVALAGACIHDARDIHAARRLPARSPGAVSTESWPVCPLIGPMTKDPGVFGTDLGFTVKRPGAEHASLAVLFGDTWARPIEGCRYPVDRADDLLAWLPAQRPEVLRASAPSGGEEAACKALSYPLLDKKSPTSWSGVRLFPNSIAESRDAQLDMSALRTPVAAWSSGDKLFGMFLRSDPAYCNHNADCERGMLCSADPAAGRKPLGACSLPIKITEDAPPMFCRDGSDCPPLITCDAIKRGVCLAEKPFTVATADGAIAPTWYRDDPRRAVATVMYIAVAAGADRPADFGVVARFITNRFKNVVARTVAHFDPDDPGKNDYRPGTHTLLIWGRPQFFERGGAQTLPFLLYQPLDALRGEPDRMQWQPRFFAGFGTHGKPQWSKDEADAQPIYGADAKVAHTPAGDQLHWDEPEFDYVNQMGMSFIAPLRRWVMLYGGDVPAFMVADPSSGHTPQAVHLQRSPGAIHMRTSRHPWGRRSADRPKSEGWSSPQPVLTRREAARYLACGEGGPKELPGCVKQGDPDDVFDLMSALVEFTPAQRAKFANRCIKGEMAMTLQEELSGNPIGRLYAPNVIDEWTDDVSDRVRGLSPGERAVEIYWNVSTWSPYQVVLVKTQLRASPGD